MQRFLFTLLAISVGSFFVFAVAMQTGPESSRIRPASERTERYADASANQAKSGKPSASADPTTSAAQGAADLRIDLTAPSATESQSNDRESPVDPRQPTDGDPAGATTSTAGEEAGTPAAQAHAASTPGSTAPVATPAQPRYRLAPAERSQNVALGEAVDSARYPIRVAMTRWGAGVSQIKLNQYREYPTDESEGGLIIASPIEAGGGQYLLYPMAARAIHIGGQLIDLQSHAWEIAAYTPPSSVTYAALVVDDAQQPIARIERRFEVEADRYELRVDQRVINLTDRPLSIVWEQNGPGDLPEDDAAYMGDRRKLTAGYFNLAYNPSRKFIYIRGTDHVRLSLLSAKEAGTDTTFFRDLRLDRMPDGRARLDVTGRPVVLWPDAGYVADLKPVWPNDDLPTEVELAWLAKLNRHFAVVIHAPVGPELGEGLASVPSLDATFPVQQLKVIGRKTKEMDQRQAIILLQTAPHVIPPREERSFNFEVFAGPRYRALFSQHPYNALFLDRLIRYELACSFCTFQWLAQWLIAFLTFIHSFTFDWAVAIIVLVLVVRLVLHPITKKAQINMTKVGRQMAALQPELEKLKKKYADNPTKFQAEQARLMRDKGINPASFLGCIPLFLQTPIWIALYAMLYYAIELRHEPAFYGIFQTISGGSWTFLNDLAAPDHFVQIFKDPIRINLIFFAPTFSGINILPLLWGILMLVQNLLMSPPATSDQMRQQQKIMRIMFLLFPLFLYNAPSGLTLYIMASTVAGIVDSWIVKRHIEEQERTGKLFEQKPVKEGGFRDRFYKMLEAQHAEMERRKGKAEGGTPPASKGPNSSKRNRPKPGR